MHSAYYFLGKMYNEGFYVKKNARKALECFIRGAAKNNAYCFFELSKLYYEGSVVEKDPRL